MVKTVHEESIVKSVTNIRAWLRDFLDWVIMEKHTLNTGNSTLWTGVLGLN